MSLSKKERDALPGDDFAVPGKRALPMHDASHVRMAWDMVSKTKDLTPEERKEARKRIIARAKSLSVDTSDWEKGKLAARMSVVSAMALNIPNDPHPNKMPFTGILTRIDEASDAPVGGSGGKLITISKEAAEGALGSLLGMAVNYKPDFDGHDVRSKIGVITDATIEGDDICIGGFIYAADFPDEAAEIKANKDLLGFSYELRNPYCDDPDANPVVITECVFTGAAILLKDKAAYRKTALAANAATEDYDMTPEQLKALADGIAAALTPGQTAITAGLTALTASMDELKKGPVALTAANMLPKIEPHAKQLETLAAAMEADGVGAATDNGHAVLLRRMAGNMRAEAAQGRIPSSFGGYYASAETKPAALDATAITTAVEAAMKPLKDANAALSTKVADLQAAATKSATPAERKTLPATITTLLAKAGIEMPKEEGAKIPISKLDDALKGMGMSQRLQVKSSLANAGLID